MKIVNLRTRTIDGWWGQTQNIDLPLDAYERLIFSVSLGSLVGGTSPAYVTNASLYAIRTMQLETEGNVLSTEPQVQVELQKYESGTAPTVGNTYSQFAIWFTKNFKDENYGPDFTKKTSLRLTLNMRPLSEITTGEPTGTSGSTLIIYGVVPDQRTNTFWGFDVASIGPTTANSTLKEAIKWNASDRSFEKILLFTTTDSGHMTASDSVIKTYTVRRGTHENIYAALDWNDSKAMDKTDYGLESLSTGVTIVDFPVGIIPAPGNELILDIVNTGSASGYVVALARFYKSL